MKILRTKTKSYSKRGYGRAYLTGGIGGVIGTAVGKRAAIKALRNGKSEEEAMEIAKKKARRVGAITNAAKTAGLFYLAHRTGIPFSKGALIAGAALGSGINAAYGAYGASIGTGKNVRESFKELGSNYNGVSQINKEEKKDEKPNTQNQKNPKKQVKLTYTRSSK